MKNEMENSSNFNSTRSRLDLTNKIDMGPSLAKGGSKPKVEPGIDVEHVVKDNCDSFVESVTLRSDGTLVQRVCIEKPDGGCC